MLHHLRNSIQVEIAILLIKYVNYNKLIFLLKFLIQSINLLRIQLFPTIPAMVMEVMAAMGALEVDMAAMEEDTVRFQL